MNNHRYWLFSERGQEGSMTTSHLEVRYVQDELWDQHKWVSCAVDSLGVGGERGKRHLFSLSNISIKPAVINNRRKRSKWSVQSCTQNERKSRNAAETKKKIRKVKKTRFILQFPQNNKTLDKNIKKIKFKSVLMPRNITSSRDYNYDASNWKWFILSAEPRRHVSCPWSLHLWHHYSLFLLILNL